MDEKINSQQLEFEQEQYEKLQESSAPPDFSPMEITQLAYKKYSTNPLFEEYGSTYEDESSVRWHLPPEVARQILQKAAQEEEREKNTVAMTEEQIESLKKQAYAEGEAAARAELESSHQQQLVGLGEKMKVVLHDLSVQMAEQLELTQQKAVELALEIAGKLLSTAVDISPEYIQAVVVQALQQAGAAKVLKVRLSPQDMEFVQVVGWDKAQDEELGRFSFEADDTIRSGCVVETTAGEIDFRLDEAWERIKDNVLKVIR